MSSRPRRLLATVLVALSALTAGCGALGQEPEAAASGDVLVRDPAGNGLLLTTG